MKAENGTENRTEKELEDKTKDFPSQNVKERKETPSLKRKATCQEGIEEMSQVLNLEDEEDIPLSVLRRKWQKKAENGTEKEIKNKTQDLPSQNVKDPQETPSLKQKATWQEEKSKVKEREPSPSKRNSSEVKSVTEKEDIGTNSWKTKHDSISNFNTYQSLERGIDELQLSSMTTILVVDILLSGDVVDDIALVFCPEDGPERMVPIKCLGDGNCFCRAISRLIYGNEDHHVEIRVRIVEEAVKRKHLYLNDTYLALGRSTTNDKDSLSKRYCMYSQCYGPGKSVEETYEDEVLTICNDQAYMGLWQIHQVANVLKRPIGMVYPIEVREDVRNDCNRMFLPSEPTEKQPIYILWTPMDANAANYKVIHFVPLVRW